MTDALHSALQGLRQVLDAPRGEGPALGAWRWTVRQRLSAVRESLVHEHGHAGNSWLTPQEDTVQRERKALLTRMAALAPTVLEAPAVDELCQELRRLVSDVARHRQHLHDLAYDDVEMELGGSE